MKNKKTLVLIYVLILIAIIAIVLLTKMVLDIPKPKPISEERNVTTVDVNPYPIVNDECTFDVTLDEYHNLKNAGCVGGYTRYNIALDNIPLVITVLYSDKEDSRAGIFINDKRITSKVSDIARIKFGVFDKKLFILDKDVDDVNVYAIDAKGNLIYNLKKALKESKVKEFATGDKTIKNTDINPESFVFYEGGFEFDSHMDICENNSSGSHYKVVYSKDKFAKPEFMKLVNC